MNKRVYYIGNDKNIACKLETYFDERRYSLLPYDLGELESVEILLIVNPYKIGGMFYDIHLLWKEYLLRNATDTKLIVLNICNECTESNAYRLLDFPNRFDKTLSEIEPLSKDMDIKLHCMSILEQLESFFKGHHHSSLYQKFNYLQMSVKNIYYAINGDIDRSFEEAKELILPMAEKLWQDFHNRWDYYKRFFVCCPFSREGKEVSLIIERVSPYFKGQINEQTESAFKEIDALSGMERVRELLDQMSEYIPQERLEEKLINAK